MNLTEVKSQIAVRDGEISDLKVHIDELKTTIKRDAAAREEMQIHYQKRIRDKQSELEQYRV